MTNYSRENPSPKYLELAEMYKQMHSEGEKSQDLKPEETFQGISLAPQLAKIKNGISLSGSKTLLDFGCGKALAWQPEYFLQVGNSRVNTKDFLELDEVYLYDPGYAPYALKPTKKFDAVICTDVLEHIPEMDLKWFIDELFFYSDKYVFANIAVYPAKKIMPNGENAHCTIKPIDWWKALFEEVAKAHKGVEWEIWIDYFEKNARQEIGIKSTEKNILNIGRLKSNIQKTLKKTSGSKVLNSLAISSALEDEVEGAKAYLQKAINLDPTFADAYLTLSSIYMEQKDYVQAQSILRSYPDYLMNNRICKQLSKNYIRIGTEYFDKSDYSPASIYLTASLEFSSVEDLPLINRGIAACMLALENNVELKKYALEAYRYDPDNVDILYYLGVYYFRMFDYEKAHDYYQRALALAPLDPFYICALAKLEIDLGDKDQAFKYIQDAYGLDPRDFDILKTYGKIMFEHQNYEESLRYYQQALAVNPNDVKTISSTAMLYIYMHNLQMAEELFLKALSLNPLEKEVLLNMEELFTKQGRYADAINILKKAAGIYPNDWQIHKNLAIRSLGVLDFKNAWDEYRYREANLDNQRNLKPDIDCLNEDLKNIRIFVVEEQGLGDELFFLRFITMLKQRGAVVVYKPKEKLRKVLLECSHIDLLEGDALSIDVDYMCRVGELPRLLNINSPTLVPDPLPIGINEDIAAGMRKQLSAYKTPLVGITWRAGTSNNIHSLSKEIPLEMLITSLKQLDATIIILQRNPLESEIKLLQEAFGESVIDASAYNDDLEQMTALLSLLDKYIAVSNTNIHLAASIQKQCHILVPFPPEWRWGNEGKSSPWFKGFKLYRQKSFDASWKDVLDDLIVDIKEELSNPILSNESSLNINHVIKRIDELIESQMYSEAEQLCQDVLSTDDANMEVLQRYAKVLTATNQYDKLLDVINKLQTCVTT